MAKTRIDYTLAGLVAVVLTGIADAGSDLSEGTLLCLRTLAERTHAPVPAGTKLAARMALVEAA